MAMSIASVVIQTLVNNNISMDINEWEDAGAVTDLITPDLLNAGIDMRNRGSWFWDPVAGKTIGNGFWFEISQQIEFPILCDEETDAIWLRDCQVTLGPP